MTRRVASRQDDGPDRFFGAAAELFEQVGVTSSTMMGLPCLRLHGTFFAAFDHRSGNLLVKLDGAEVDRMVDSGEGHPFAPAGRRFREWVAIPPGQDTAWPTLIRRAFDLAATRLDQSAGGREP